MVLVRLLSNFLINQQLNSNTRPRTRISFLKWFKERSRQLICQPYCRKERYITALNCGWFRASAKALIHHRLQIRVMESKQQANKYVKVSATSVYIYRNKTSIRKRLYLETPLSYLNIRKYKLRKERPDLHAE